MSADATAGSYGLPVKHEFKLPEIITAASAGTVIDWYDFYIFGTLTPIISPFFFPNAAGDPILSLLVGLLTFWVGFAVRPFGAIVFGRIGDLIGRKYTFLVTLVIMGGSTTVIGLIPTYASIGIAAPLILATLRILQGLALGGEYGGAAIYVAEHAPDGRRGYYTSWIQTTATVGLFVSLLVILATRLSMSPEQFADPGYGGGWRIPFILSFVLVLGSLYIRMRLRESPLYAALKESGKTSTQPIKDSLGNRRNWKLIALALFGAVAGQGVVWYTGQFYALTFMTAILKVPTNQAYIITTIALILGTPFFVVFGSLSDRIGRKKLMMAGLALAVVLYVPIYWLMTKSVTLPPAGSPATATSTDINSVALVLLVFVQLIFATMAYGPIAAFLVELFPARIRYTSMSLPYHLGNGVIGGLVPFIATATVAETGNPIAGVFYPVAVALITLVIGWLYLPETTHTRIWDEVQDADDAGNGRMPQPA
jgi:MFS family permease